MNIFLRAMKVGGIFALALSPAQGFAQELGLTYYGISVDELEYRQGDESESLAAWSADAFMGTDEFKVRLLSQGEYDLDASKLESFENQLVGQIPISDFFDAKAGVRLDRPNGPNRWYGVLGLTGLAPQWFDMDANLFLSEKGDASARIEAEYELLITNHLILTPSIEVDVAFSDDAEIGIGSGLSTAEIGARLSYDVVDRLFSPYIGIVHEQKFGNTADYAKNEGEDTKSWFAVIGTKFVF